MYNVQSAKSDKPKEFETNDLVLYMLCTAGEIKGYTKFHRIAYLANKKLQEKGYFLKNVNFSEKIFNGPYDEELQKRIEFLGSINYLDNTDIPAFENSKIFTHRLSPKRGGELRAMQMEHLFEDKKTLKEIKKIVLDLKDKPLDEIDRILDIKIPEEGYVSIDKLPEGLREDILRIKKKIDEENM